MGVKGVRGARATELGVCDRVASVDGAGSRDGLDDLCDPNSPSSSAEASCQRSLPRAWGPSGAESGCDAAVGRDLARRSCRGLACRSCGASSQSAKQTMAWQRPKSIDGSGQAQVSLAAGEGGSEKRRCGTGGAWMEAARLRRRRGDRQAADRSLGGWGSAVLQGPRRAKRRRIHAPCSA